MSRACELVVFARAPILGGVKGRLAHEIGQAEALRAYREMTAVVIGRVAGDPRWRTWIAATPDRYASRGRFWPATVRRLPQRQGALGTRMARSLSAFPRCRVVIIGTDIPCIRSGHVAEAFDALRSHDYVFGPTTDGGYWLIGAAPGRPVLSLLNRVRWSGPDALSDTLANVASPRRCALLETLEDIDDAAALARWRERTGG